MLPVESLMKVAVVKLFHASEEWSAKILCLQINNGTLIDNQTPLKLVLKTFLMPELQFLRIEIPGLQITNSLFHLSMLGWLF